MPSGTETREAPSGSSGASWIKICGITRPEDAEVAVIEGANAIGLVFVDVSPRRVVPTAAAEIARSPSTAVTRTPPIVARSPSARAATVRHSAPSRSANIRIMSSRRVSWAISKNSRVR